MCFDGKTVIQVESEMEIDSMCSVCGIQIPADSPNAVAHHLESHTKEDLISSLTRQQASPNAQPRFVPAVQQQQMQVMNPSAMPMMVPMAPYGGVSMPCFMPPMMMPTMVGGRPAYIVYPYMMPQCMNGPFSPGACYSQPAVQMQSLSYPVPLPLTMPSHSPWTTPDNASLSSMTESEVYHCVESTEDRDDPVPEEEDGTQEEASMTSHSTETEESIFSGLVCHVNPDGTLEFVREETPYRILTDDGGGDEENSDKESGNTGNGSKSGIEQLSESYQQNGKSGDKDGGKEMLREEEIEDYMVDLDTTNDIIEEGRETDEPPASDVEPGPSSKTQDGTEVMARSTSIRECGTPKTGTKVRGETMTDRRQLRPRTHPSEREDVPPKDLKIKKSPANSSSKQRKGMLTGKQILSKRMSRKKVAGDKEGRVEKKEGEMEEEDLAWSDGDRESVASDGEPSSYDLPPQNPLVGDDVNRDSDREGRGNDEEEEEIVLEEKESPVKLHSCPTCEKVFAKKKYMRNHLRYVHGPKNFKCKYCDKSFKWKHGLESHMYTHCQRGGYECYLCDATFKGPSYLQRHVNRHYSKTRDKTFFYCECGKAFETKGAYEWHQEVHKGIRHFCKVCSVSFLHKGSLNRHYRVSHPDSEEAISLGGRKCLVCHKMVKNLTLHMRSHGSKKFKCSMCQKTFTHRCNLQAHQLLHAPNMEKPYQCKVCKRGFIREDKLKDHVVQHSRNKARYTCSECDKRFAIRTTYFLHMREHVNPGYFPCYQCGKAFTRSSYLKAHQKVHGPPQNFPCPTCRKVFAWRSNMIKHLQKHHRAYFTEEV
ncbi:unnamed protein product [Darwinula stevensoni]|uniref:C2H2-type domain-containing protein n=1 Tax=Darwinula stevensoni TaxID=69355 RepID=A0A7R9AAD4_9CRUS|nr:unnamed protein product [Darwinula stevensoni]CAG0897966.1 unnamed protein product [Darwinula stevensoni]